MNVVLKRDVTELLATEAAFNRTMLLAITGAVFLIVLILFLVQRSVFSGLQFAIQVLQKLTDGETVNEIRRPKGLLNSANNEVGQLIRALRSIRISWTNCYLERSAAPQSRTERSIDF